ncbi:hypothetical protein TGMAS_416450 [Toxoplasma gondii MAS]|uniref:Uncharacterized protein n=1 Tax=Toxoplasma gondii MAS TaxID=943118 RepID=A0A086PWZ6_TOXGO|nr:hypothetical protein TGMAS_416450 [Toxoplasma gondii MAS]
MAKTRNNMTELRNSGETCAVKAIIVRNRSTRRSRDREFHCRQHRQLFSVQRFDRDQDFDLLGRSFLAVLATGFTRNQTFEEQQLARVFLRSVPPSECETYRCQTNLENRTAMPLWFLQLSVPTRRDVCYANKKRGVYQGGCQNTAFPARVAPYMDIFGTTPFHRLASSESQTPTQLPSEGSVVCRSEKQKATSSGFREE